MIHDLIIIILSIIALSLLVIAGLLISKNFLKPKTWYRIPIVLEKEGKVPIISWMNFRMDSLVMIKPSISEDGAVDGTGLYFKNGDNVYVPTRPSTVLTYLKVKHVKIPIEIVQVVDLNKESNDPNSNGEDSYS